jgi:membrane associated rhomboid family serine protease
MTPWVRRLLIANVAVFFVQMTMPTLTSGFAFVPVLVLVRPWSIITYMFLHGGIGHILFNMLGLFFFGPRVEERLGHRRFAVLYFTSGIAGALLSAVLAPSAAIVGASAAIFGVMFAFAHFWPRDQILIWGIIPVEARWLVVITTVLALWSGMGGSRGGVADFAHLGGYAGAFLYLRWVEARRGMAKFQRQASAPANERALANWQKVNVTAAHELNRDELNRVLDKISASGLGSLTPQERQFLSNFVPPDDRTPPLAPSGQ